MPKGKGVDPGNWANADFSDRDIDHDQHAALKSRKTAQEWPRSQSGSIYGNVVAMAGVSVGGSCTMGELSTR